MTYSEFSRYLSSYGFTSNPITIAQWPRIAKLPIDTQYGIACDCAAGLTFRRAYAIAIDRLNEGASA
jgi:hypothetical protein